MERKHILFLHLQTVILATIIFLKNELSRYAINMYFDKGIDKSTFEKHKNLITLMIILTDSLFKM
jgi:hypothetical protein